MELITVSVLNKWLDWLICESVQIDLLDIYSIELNKFIGLIELKINILIVFTTDLLRVYVPYLWHTAASSTLGLWW